MPLIFTSTMLVPARNMPEWLASVSYLNPLTHVVNSVRGAALYGSVDIGIGTVLVPGIIFVCFYVMLVSGDSGQESRSNGF
jgi:ABC-type multidrug transport system permease subunit